MNMKKTRLAALVLTGALLTGCGIGSSVDTLLLPPMLSDEQEAIYTALTASAGSNISLVYPRGGAYRSAFVFYDLDMDGADEAVVFYDDTDDSENSVRVNILHRENNGWRSVYDHAGAGSYIEQVFFADLGGTGRVRMAIGYGYMTPTEKTLKIYSLGDGVLNTEYTETYYKTMNMDMDGDGTPELYCGAGLNGQHMYSYADGKIYALDIPEGVSNFGTDVSPCTQFYVGKAKAYLVSGQEVMNNNPVTFWTKQGDKAVVVLTYTDGFDWDAETPTPVKTINGQSVTAEEFSSAILDFTGDMDEQYYSFWESPYNSDRALSPRSALQDTITSLRKLTNPTAHVSRHKVTLNGAKADLAAYTINSNNYFKLRDLAKALKGLDYEFEVKWNAAQQRIDLTSRTAYTPVGGEQAALPAGNKAATLTNASVYLDGKPLSLTAYSIGGNNYFKLRDLVFALGFSVDWDNATSTVTISAQ